MGIDPYDFAVWIALLVAGFILWHWYLWGSGYV